MESVLRNAGTASMQVEDGLRATAEGTGGGTEGDTFNLTRVGQILWGVRYIDDAVMRQVSTAFTDTPPEGGSPAVLSVDWNDAIDEEEGRTAKRWWYLTDVQFSVVGLIDPTWGSMVVERVEYSPYGVPLYQPATDFDGDGDVDTADEFAFLDAWYAQCRTNYIDVPPVKSGAE